MKFSFDNALIMGMLIGIAAQIGKLQRIQRELERIQRELEHIQGRLSAIDRGEGLTEREYTVLHLRLAGVTVDDVAKMLNHSKRTIEYDITALKDKGLL